jgi:hypothetical protein
MRNLFVALFATAGIAGAATLIAAQSLSGAEGLAVNRIDSSVRRGTRPVFVTPSAGSAMPPSTEWSRGGSRVDHKPAVVTRKSDAGAPVRRGT